MSPYTTPKGTDYNVWGMSELIERIHDLETEFKVHERCAHCNDSMYTIVRAHHHTENGVDVTK